MPHIPPAQPPSFPALTPHMNFPPPQPAPVPHYQTPQAPPTYQQPITRPQQVVYNKAPPVEVFHLADAANSSIPPEIREQFHQDQHGHILFFTAPPVDAAPPVKAGAALGHSARYLAAKAKREATLAEKRKRENDGSAHKDEERKRMKTEVEIAFQGDVAALTAKALEVFGDQLLQATVKEYETLPMDGDAKGRLQAELETLEKIRKDETRKQREREERVRREKEKQKVPITGVSAALEDVV